MDAKQESGDDERARQHREGTMATEFTVSVENKPGTLARLGSVLGDATVNIEAIHGTSREEKGVVQFVPSDPG